MYRIGQGFDIHRICRREAKQSLSGQERELMLGGIMIKDSPYVAIGHSDADCLLHAIIDSLLGALALGDIGQHFPDSDPDYQGISSAILLKQVYEMVRKRHYIIVNLDTTVILEQPRIAPYIVQIRTRIAELLHLNLDDVSVKAKTNEKVDAIGTGQAISAQAIVLLQKDSMKSVAPKSRC